MNLRSPKRYSTWYDAAIIAAAICAFLAPLSEAVVERVYSTGVYRILQRSITAVSNSAPFALVDLLIVGVTLGWLSTAILDLSRARKTGWARAVLAPFWRTAVWAAALYLLFLFTWGLNYRRVPLRERLPFDSRAVTEDAARQLALTSVEQANALYDAAHVEPPPVSMPGSALAVAFRAADRDVNGGDVVLGRPKTTIANWYFRRAAVDGMTDPYFLETLVVSDLLPFERPFVVAHEWSHLAGIADEGEANFLAWLACIHGSEADQYSGWLFLYRQAAATLPRRERAELAARLAPGPRADLRAMSDRIARNVSPTISAAGWRVYDRYLKANRVESGAASYTEVVRLVLGTRFDADWRPLRGGVSESR